MPRFKKEGITINLSKKLKTYLENKSAENQMAQAEYMRYLLQKQMDIDENKNNEQIFTTD